MGEEVLAVNLETALVEMMEDERDWAEQTFVAQAAVAEQQIVAGRTAAALYADAAEAGQGYIAHFVSVLVAASVAIR